MMVTGSRSLGKTYLEKMGGNEDILQTITRKKNTPRLDDVRTNLGDAALDSKNNVVVIVVFAG